MRESQVTWAKIVATGLQMKYFIFHLTVEVVKVFLKHMNTVKYKYVMIKHIICDPYYFDNYFIFLTNLLLT